MTGEPHDSWPGPATTNFLDRLIPSQQDEMAGLYFEPVGEGVRVWRLGDEITLVARSLQELATNLIGDGGGAPEQRETEGVLELDFSGPTPVRVYTDDLPAFGDAELHGDVLRFVDVAPAPPPPRPAPSPSPSASPPPAAAEPDEPAGGGGLVLLLLVALGLGIAVLAAWFCMGG